MTVELLGLDDLARGLERYGDRYQRFTAFADDVDDLVSLAANPRARSLVAIAADRYRVELGGTTYLLEIRPTGAIVLARAPEAAANEAAPEAAANEAAPEVAEEAAALVAKAVTSAAERKGQGFAAGLILGLLSGPALRPNDLADGPHRIFPLRFDGETRQWRAYDGGLLRWMKEHLTASSAQVRPQGTHLEP